MPDAIFLPAFSAGMAALFATFAVADFFIYLSRRYRDRFIEETALEFDDILLQMPPGRVLDLSLALAVVGAFLGVGLSLLLLDSPSWQAALFAALAGAIVLFPVPRLVLRQMRRRRLERFNDQLEDALGMMSSSLKAGFSIMQSLEEVAGCRKRPVSLEFRLLIQEIQLGVPLEQALDNMTARIGSADLELISLSIITARQTGGELPAAFDRLASMIRERIRVQQKMRSATAQGRLQLVVISCMPYLLLIGLLFVMPRASEIFFGTPLGWISLGVVTLLVIAGAWVAKIMTRIDF